MAGHDRFHPPGRRHVRPDRPRARSAPTSTPATESNGVLFTDADDVWGDGTAANPETAAVDAAYGAQTTWDSLPRQLRPQRHSQRRPR
ncbi:hypothetical protein [Streptomyces sp. KL116D]|uniref:hypothetical protein n=1 Tax=Streptomyces sp. KL116D TaxID=3045152 RepID=UPI0035563F96